MDIGFKFMEQLIVVCPFNIQNLCLCSCFRNCIVYVTGAHIIIIIIIVVVVVAVVVVVIVIIIIIIISVNRTEWSPLRSVITRVISKIG